MKVKILVNFYILFLGYEEYYDYIFPEENPQ